MTKIILDAEDVFEQFLCVAYLFDFYPHHFDGLIIDLVAYHHKQPFTNDENDHDFVENAMQLYRESPDYSVYLNDAEGTVRENLIYVTLIMVNRSAWEFVRSQRQHLGICQVRPENGAMGTQLEYVMFDHI